MKTLIGISLLSLGLWVAPVAHAQTLLWLTVPEHDVIDAAVDKLQEKGYVVDVLWCRDVISHMYRYEEGEYVDPLCWRNRSGCAFFTTWPSTGNLKRGYLLIKNDPERCYRRAHSFASATVLALAHCMEDDSDVYNEHDNIWGYWTDSVWITAYNYYDATICL